MSTTFPRPATRVLSEDSGTIPPAGEWRTGEALLKVHGDFGCVRDSRGNNQFTPFWFTLLDAADPLAVEWATNWRARGYTHVVVSPHYGYPGSPIDGRDFTPERFADLCIEGLNLGMTLMIMLTDYPSEMPRALRVVEVLKKRGLLPYVWLCVGWEIVGPGGTYRSKEAYDANVALEQACEGVDHYIFAHLQPGRASFASNPVQDDDPWAGNEKQCWHDMPFIRMFAYQTEHEGWEDDPPLWEDRWRDVVPRFCNGMNGWRVMQVCLFETVLYNDYHGEFGSSGEAKAREVAARGRDIAAEYGATVTYGNGAPTA